MIREFEQKTDDEIKLDLLRANKVRARRVNMLKGTNEKIAALQAEQFFRETNITTGTILQSKEGQQAVVEGIEHHSKMDWVKIILRYVRHNGKYYVSSNSIMDWALRDWEVIGYQSDFVKFLEDEKNAQRELRKAA